MMGCSHGPINNSRWHKNRMVAGKTIASLSKDIGKFLDATAVAKKLHKKKVYQVRAFRRQLGQVVFFKGCGRREEQLKERITQTYGRSKYLELLKFVEKLAEKREAEAQARRDHRIKNSHHSWDWCF